jgi:hypothetical protein
MDIIEREGDRIYINRTPPCGHNNGTHPSGCWYIAVCDAVAPLNAEIARLRTIEEAARQWAESDSWENEAALRAALGSER